MITGDELREAMIRTYDEERLKANAPRIEDLPKRIHFWFVPEAVVSYCGAIRPGPSEGYGHPECGPWFPNSVDQACPTCFRPICARCLRVALELERRLKP